MTIAPRQRSTIRQVAELVGVSVSTVSLALSDHPAVAAQTKQRVRDAAAQLNYRPSAVGRALQSQRTNAVGLIIPHSDQHVFSHLYFMEILAGVSAVLNAADMTLVVSTAPTEDAEDAAYLKVLRAQQVDGVILASAAIADQNVTALRNSGAPFVFIGRYPQDRSVAAVGIDDVGGARAATQHLLGRGQRRIAHISGPLGHRSSLDRQHGYQHALAAAGVAVDPQLLIEGDYSEESGAHAMAALLQLDTPPTALFAANDEMAIGAFAALRAAGITPGPDFPVVGFDDVLFARLVTPALTTVHQPMRQLGMEAATRLLSQIAGDPLPHTQLELPTHLVIRASCGSGV